MAIATVNPTTGKSIQDFAPLTDAELAAKVALGDRTFNHYRHTPLEQRSRWLHQLADRLEQDCAELAHLAVLEMGKPIAAAKAELQKCVLVCRFYADRAAEFLADEIVETDASRSFVRPQPLGIVLAVMPWNFPYWQVFRFAAPALMAGNVALLKHASNVPQVALRLEQLVREAGFPEGAFQTLLIGGDRVAALVGDERIRAATLTGSEAAGISLASACGQHLKKTVLELGGSDPLIVCPSADVAQAAAVAVAARMLNNGQSCIAAKRFIAVGDRVAADLEQAIARDFAVLVVGDPTDSATQLGPLATPQILADLETQVAAAIAAGGRVVTGGDRAALLDRLPPALRSGYFYPPTLLADVPIDAAIAREEFFGPVALLFRVETIEQAIALANDTPFGLGASVWTQDAAEIDRCVAGIEAGAVFVNGMVKSDPRLPFGGIKRSGYGRELARQGLLEFVNLKTVWIA